LYHRDSKEEIHFFKYQEGGERMVVTEGTAWAGTKGMEEEEE